MKAPLSFITLDDIPLNSNNIHSVLLYRGQSDMIEGEYNINEEGEILVINEKNEIAFKLPSIKVGVDLFKSELGNYRGIECVVNADGTYALSLSLNTYLRAISNRNAVSYARSWLANLNADMQSMDDFDSVYLRFVCKDSLIEEGFLMEDGCLYNQFMFMQEAKKFFIKYNKRIISKAEVIFSLSKYTIHEEEVYKSSDSFHAYSIRGSKMIKAWCSGVDFVLPNTIYNQPYSEVLTKLIKRFLHINSVSKESHFFLRKKYMIYEVLDGLSTELKNSNNSIEYTVSCVKSAYAVISLLYKEARVEDKVTEHITEDIKLLEDPKYDNSVDFVENMKIFAEYTIMCIKATPTNYKIEYSPEERFILGDSH